MHKLKVGSIFRLDKEKHYKNFHSSDYIVDKINSDGSICVHHMLSGIIDTWSSNDIPLDKILPTGSDEK